MPRRLHFERHLVTWAITLLLYPTVEVQPNWPRLKHNHSPEPREWCPHRRRQRCTGHRSFGTDRRRFALVVITRHIHFMSCKLWNMTAELELLSWYLPLGSCKQWTELCHKLSLALRSTAGALSKIKYQYLILSLKYGHNQRVKMALFYIFVILHKSHEKTKINKLLVCFQYQTFNSDLQTLSMACKRPLVTAGHCCF